MHLWYTVDSLLEAALPTSLVSQMLQIFFPFMHNNYTLFIYNYNQWMC